MLKKFKDSPAQSKIVSMQSSHWDYLLFWLQSHRKSLIHCSDLPGNLTHNQDCTNLGTKFPNPRLPLILPALFRFSFIIIVTCNKLL